MNVALEILKEVKVCKRGHARTRKNTYHFPNGYTACRVCQRQQWREYWDRKKKKEAV